MYRERVAGGKARHPRPSRRPGRDTTTEIIERAVRAEISRGGPVLLAVSGGRDSMVLLETFARVAPQSVAGVAAFDHGTGVAASAAAALVRERAAFFGMAFRGGISTHRVHTEAEWRTQRMAFLSAVARDFGARILTGHTLDDHLETVLMRELRGSGARGLAGLLSPSAVGRPFVELSRATIAEGARVWSVPFVEDPTNRSRRHLRNRVRMDMLPALARVRPALPSDLLDLSRRAARLRANVDRWIDAHVGLDRQEGTQAARRGDLAGLRPPELAMVWAALAARQGVTLDRRGTERVVSFTIQGAPGARIQLSGGAEVVRHREWLILRRASLDAASDVSTLRHGAVWGEWRFVETGSVTDEWTAALTTDRPLEIRGWRAGDRMIASGSTTPRRLKGLFRDAGVDAGRRRRWPVVVAGEDVVWVPGVRRALAAPARSGRPIVTFRCEHIDR